MRGATVLVDTGPLVALFDPSDRAHASCTRELAKLEGRRLITSLAVVTEATYLLDFSGRAQRALLTFVADGAIEIAPIDATGIRRIESLMLKYEDLPMDFADATLVLLAEALDALSVFTLDRKDFGIYRVGRRKFGMLPVRV